MTFVERLSDLDTPMISDARVERLLADGALAEALEMARDNLHSAHDDAAGTASSLADLAWVTSMTGATKPALQAALESIDLAPTSRQAFHNLAAILLAHRQCRGSNRGVLIEHMKRVINVVPWPAAYRSLFWQPRFLNLEFVKGKCNLKCRMCIGINSPNHPNRLSAMEVEDFRQMLLAAPTVAGITLSSSDSDPLLHPRLSEILDVAKELGVTLDLYTNGLPLGERMTRRILESQRVGMINFSIDAATEETYQRIRGGDLNRLHRNLQRLVTLRREGNHELPHLSFSFVAMADNIEELPAFVEMAARYGCRRVFVEDLLGWLTERGGNHPATDHPECHAFVAQARRLATQAGLSLVLPERLLHARPAAVPSRTQVVAWTGTTSEARRDAPGQDEAAPPRLHRCGWIDGVWVSQDGTLQPCSMLSGVADMGSVHDGPLHTNQRFNHVKALLFEGKVFPECANKTMCTYVQQQLKSGTPMEFITRQELGPAAMERNADDPSRIRLPVLTVDAANA